MKLETIHYYLMRPIAVTVCLAVFPAVVLSAEGSKKGPSPIKLLESLAERRLTLETLEYTAETIVKSGNRTSRQLTQNWEMHDKRQCKYRRISTSVPNKKGAVPTKLTSVFDGENLWSEVDTAEGKIAYKMKANSVHTIDEIVSIARAGKVKLKRKEKIRKTPCVVVSILGEPASTLEKGTYWISEKQGVVLKSQSHHRDGSVREFLVTSWSVKPAVDPALFIYNPADGIKVVAISD